MKTEAEQRAWEAHASGLDEKLLRMLEQRTAAAGLTYADPPAPLGGGHWASLYRFRLRDAPAGLAGDLVLRVMPTSDELGLREATIQAAVAAAGFPAPRVHFAGGREAFGFPYILMALADGGVARDAASLGRLPALLGETMARLHALDERPVAEALAKAGVPALDMTTLLEDLGTKIAPLAGGNFAAGLAWLKGNRPAERASAVCHGDLHPFNLLVANGRVNALLDWSQALLADPAFDVAYTAQLLSLWPVELRLVPRPLGRIAGHLAAVRFLEAYRATRALPDALQWHKALHAFRLLVRVASARAGVAVPPLAANHPWELVADDAVRAFARHSGVRTELPPR